MLKVIGLVLMKWTHPLILDDAITGHVSLHSGPTAHDSCVRALAQATAEADERARELIEEESRTAPKPGVSSKQQKKKKRRSKVKKNTSRTNSVPSVEDNSGPTAQSQASQEESEPVPLQVDRLIHQTSDTEVAEWTPVKNAKEIKAKKAKQRQAQAVGTTRASTVKAKSEVDRKPSTTFVMTRDPLAVPRSNTISAHIHTAPPSKTITARSALGPRDELEQGKNELSAAGPSHWSERPSSSKPTKTGLGEADPSLLQQVSDSSTEFLAKGQTESPEDLLDVSTLPPYSFSLPSRTPGHSYLPDGFPHSPTNRYSNRAETLFDATSSSPLPNSPSSPARVNIPLSTARSPFQIPELNMSTEEAAPEHHFLNTPSSSDIGTVSARRLPHAGSHRAGIPSRSRHKQKSRRRGRQRNARRREQRAAAVFGIYRTSSRLLSRYNKVKARRATRDTSCRSRNGSSITPSDCQSTNDQDRPQVVGYTRPCLETGRTLYFDFTEPSPRHVPRSGDTEPSRAYDIHRPLVSTVPGWVLAQAPPFVPNSHGHDTCRTVQALPRLMQLNPEGSTRGHELVSNEEAAAIDETIEIGYNCGVLTAPAENVADSSRCTAVVTGRRLFGSLDAARGPRPLYNTSTFCTVSRLRLRSSRMGTWQEVDVCTDELISGTWLKYPTIHRVEVPANDSTGAPSTEMIPPQVHELQRWKRRLGNACWNGRRQLHAREMFRFEKRSDPLNEETEYNFDVGWDESLKTVEPKSKAFGKLTRWSVWGPSSKVGYRLFGQRWTRRTATASSPRSASRSIA